MSSAAPAIESYLGELERSGGRGTELDAGLVAAVRAYLADARAHLEGLHRGGASGQTVNETNSDLTDRLIRRLFRLAESEYYAGGAEFGQRLSAVAAGGYARREMSIHSDIDLLFLYPRKLNPFVEKVTNRIQTWLWDGGLTVGGATRTVAETLELAAQDVTVRTAILDARFLVGDVELFHEFSDAVLEDLLGDKEAFLAERMEALRSRHEKYGESLYLLQPNIKEGAGGLRDYHTAYWATRAAHPATRGLDDLLNFGLLTESEMAEYRAALQFLWRVRNELHLLAGRKNDQMSFELQERIARNFRYGERSEAALELPVERFMGDYYRNARAIQGYSELVVEQCQARVRRHAARPAPREVEDGFRLAGDSSRFPMPGTCASSRSGCSAPSKWRRPTTSRSRARRGAWCARTSAWRTTRYDARRRRPAACCVFWNPSSG